MEHLFRELVMHGACRTGSSLGELGSEGMLRTGTLLYTTTVNFTNTVHLVYTNWIKHMFFSLIIN